MRASSVRRDMFSMPWRSTTTLPGASRPNQFCPADCAQKNFIRATIRLKQGETTMFTRYLSYALCVAAFSLLSNLPARAHKIEVGTGIFCDTQRQVERFVALFDGDAKIAMDAVNAEENDPTACILGTVAFIRSPEFVTARNKNDAYHVVRVLVIGFFSEAG